MIKFFYQLNTVRQTIRVWHDWCGFWSYIGRC